MAEFLNVEIVLNTIRDSGTSLKQWIRKTFFYVRIMKSMAPQQAADHLNGMFIKFNLKNYKLWSNLTFSNESIEKIEQLQTVQNRFKRYSSFCVLPYVHARLFFIFYFSIARCYSANLQCKVYASSTLSTSCFLIDEHGKRAQLCELHLQHGFLIRTGRKCVS